MSEPTRPEYEDELVVARRDVAADGVAALTLRRPDGAPLPPWRPGAHVELLLEDGLVRPYSLCGDPGDPTAWRIGVLRVPESRGGSAHVHDKLTQGAAVRVRGPRDTFGFRPARRYLFVAGGIGITPLLPMVAEAHAAGAGWRLVYGGRSRSSMAFLDELAPYGPAVDLYPQDERGLPDLARHLAAPDPDTLVYCCGPEPLLAAVTERCAAAWPAGALRTERFRPGSRPGTAADAPFDVVLSASGRTLRVEPGRTVLETVREAGIAAPSSCAEGICGTCETEVLAGEPDHRDSVLGAEEKASGETMMICVSRSLSPRLVLDL
ncbi:PDR/VanB family oxidoreductase [Streptomyces sp. NPDC093085]|uniref:PDR/VanB family oxidoreductase n=1 Tax=Streptomyces sp. NPDC093085 TaxID=3155068 RepID=UPI003434C3B9